MGHVAYGDAKKNVGELTTQVVQGEEVIIQREEGRCFRLVEVNQERPPRVFGCAKGEIQMLEGFDDPLEEVEDYT